jgi:hypothetical protein
MHESPTMDGTGRTTAPTRDATHDEVLTGGRVSRARTSTPIKPERLI